MDTNRATPSWSERLQDELPMLVGPILMVLADVIWLVVHGTPLAHQALRNALVFAVGVGGLIAAIGHTVLRDQVAESIGWAKGSPFQLEVGFANLAIGIVGIMSAWYQDRFWLAVIVVVSVFLVCDAGGHIADMVRRRNFAPSNAGFVFWWDLALPALLITLYAIQ
ncbi:MAG TPA: DUF6790 family protein [Acidimicrobiia bacterium]|nr:DUF6790 family protein [Acidimicrobiia bacterium]